jgi:hypothetical protein
MGLDIRLPIGLMFLVMGVLLVIYGLMTGGDSMYNLSLNININLWWGLAMSLFGLILFVFARKGGQDKVKSQSAEGIATEERERRLGLEHK